MKSKAVIDVWVCDLTFPGYMDRLFKLGEEFENAHPGYRIDIQGFDFRELPRKIAEAARQDRAPAVAEYYMSATQTARDMLGRNGRPLFASVAQAIGGRTEILGEPVVTGDIIPAVRAYYTYDGELTSMPSVVTTAVLYANTTAIQAAGVPGMPRTWDEVEAACAAVAAARASKGDGPSHAITWANHGMFFQQGVGIQGGQFVSSGNPGFQRITSVDVASAEMLTWVKWWQRLHRAGHYLYTGKIPDWAGNLNVFANQQVALRISSSNDVNYMVRAAENSGFGIEVSPFPRTGQVANAGHAMAGTSFWLADGLDDDTKDGALAFLQYLHNPRNAADRHKANSFVPLTTASFELLERAGWFDEHPYHRVASDQLETANGALPSFPFGDFSGAQDVMTRGMADVLLRDADPGERFAQVAAQTQKLLDEYLADCAGTGPKSPNSLRVEFFADAEEYTSAELENVVGNQPARTGQSEPATAAVS